MLRLPLRARRTAAFVVPCLIAATVLAGCGGAGSNGETAKAARQIVTDAQKATMGAPSVHLSGSNSSTSSPLRLDVVAGPSRGGGTITSGRTVLNLILDRANLFIKADAATIQSITGNAATARADANRWLRTSSASDNFTGLSQLVDITRLPQSFTFSGSPTKQAPTMFDGMKVVPLFDPASGGTLYVAATGKPYIIGIKGATSKGGATLTFDHYGTAKVPSAPPNPITLNPKKAG
ncbi:MAG: hypothetical protein M3137_19005 [Actinomycetota bacterium]|nr:hypothetical protein [Actinomycetota bacterium]